MNGTAYCGVCGTQLGAGAGFCRACGAAQDQFAQPVAAEKIVAAPQPSPTPQYRGVAVAYASPQRRRASGAAGLAAVLAIVGGLGICVVVLYATVYYPLKFHYGINFGDSLQFGDVLGLVSGAVAMALGVLILRQRVHNRGGVGLLLALAGVPTLVLALLWTYPETFHLSPYSVPFYTGYLYFTDFGVIRIGSGDVPVPLIGSTLAVIAAGALIAFFAPRPLSGGAGR